MTLVFEQSFAFSEMIFIAIVVDVAIAVANGDECGPMNDTQSLRDKKKSFFTKSDTFYKVI